MFGPIPSFGESSGRFEVLASFDLVLNQESNAFAMDA